MPIGDEFQLFPYSKAARHISGTTVWTGVQFYSLVQDLADEPGMMGYEEIIKYNTPTSFTMLNGWFLDNGDGSNILQFLKGASFDTSGYATIDDPVYMLDMDGPTTDFVATDKDKDIEDDGAANDVGPLLAYLNDYPGAGQARIWVRDTNSNGTIADNSVITVEGGTGGGNAFGASVSGDETYCNLYTIEDFPADVPPQVYIYQAHPQSGTRVRIAEWSGYSNWDRGGIDVVIPVRLGGTLIDSGLVKVLVHQPGDTFTFVEVDLSSGSRTPVGTETAADEVNVTKGEWYLMYENEAGGGFTADDVMQDVATDSGTPPNWYAEVVSVVADWGTSGVLQLRGFRNPEGISDTDAIFVGTTQRGTANGTPGDTYVTYDASTTAPVDGDRGLPFEGSVSGAHRVLRGYEHDGPGGKLVFQTYHTHGTLDSQDYTGAGRNVLYRDLADNDVVDAPSGGTGLMAVTLDADSTTLISGYSDITIAHISGSVTISSLVGTFELGERVTWNAGASEAIAIADNGSTSLTLGNVDPADEPDAADAFIGDKSGATANCDSGLTDSNTYGFAFPQQSSNNYSIAIQGGDLYEAGRTLSDLYAYGQYYVSDGKLNWLYPSDGSTITPTRAEEYTKPETGYAANKGAPFGNKAGSLFQGAQGVWVEGFAAADANNVSFRDDAYGGPWTPYKTITIDIGNTREDDVIRVAPRDVATNKIDKDQYTSHASNNVQGDSTFEKDSGNFPVDTPASGLFTVVDNAKNEQHDYRYISWTGGTITLAGKVTGTAEAGTSGQTLVDTGVFASGVQRGDIIRNTTDASWGYIVEVTDNDTVVTTRMLDANKQNVDWEIGDGFEINALVETYDVSDTFWIDYMYVIEDTGTDGAPGSAQQQILYADVDRAVLVRVRNVTYTTEMQPYVGPQTIGENGLTLNVTRNEDEVYTP